MWEINKDRQVVCKHWECPYRDCTWHQSSTFRYTSLSPWEDLPFYMPKDSENIENCMSYMDV